MRKAVNIIYTAFIMQWKMRCVTPFSAIALVLSPLAFLLVTLFLFKEEQGNTGLMRAVIGCGVIGVWSSVLTTSGRDIQAERWQGTLELIIASPASLELSIIGKALANSTMGIVSVGLSFVVTRFVFGQSITISHPTEFLISLALLIWSCACLGLVISTAFTLSRAAAGFGNGIELLVYILSGLLFPITLLPRWLTLFSYPLSLTWGMQALTRSAGVDNASLELTRSWALMVLLGLMYSGLSHWLFRVIDKQLRSSGEMGYQ